MRFLKYRITEYFPFPLFSQKWNWSQFHFSSISVLHFLWNWYTFPIIVIVGYLINNQWYHPIGLERLYTANRIWLSFQPPQLSVTISQASATMIFYRMHRVRTITKTVRYRRWGPKPRTRIWNQLNRFDSDIKYYYELIYPNGDRGGKDVWIISSISSSPVLIG